MSSFATEGFTYLALSLVIVAIRLLIRARQGGVSNLFVDDYLMVVALLPYTTETVLAYMVGQKYQGLTNSGMTDEERASLSVDDEEYGWRVGGSKVQVAGWCVYVSVIWCIKASLCAFYSRLTETVNGYRIRILIGYIAIGVTYIALILTLLLSCQPFHAFWQINPNPGNFCQPAVSKLYILMTVCLNVATDIYLILIPVPMLWGARLPWLKKLSLIVLFSGATFVMMAGILRGVLILRDPIRGPRQGSAWAVRESFVAVATSNLPMIWGWLQTKLKPLLGSLLSSDHKRYAGPNHGSIMLANTNDNNSRKQQSTMDTSVNGEGSTRGLEPTDYRDTSFLDVQASPPNQGGITKHVAISVSSQQAPSSDGEEYNQANRFDAPFK